MAELIKTTELLFKNGYDRDNGGASKSISYRLTFDTNPESFEEVERLSGFLLGERHPISTHLVLVDISIESEDNCKFILNANWVPEQLSNLSTSEEGEEKPEVLIGTWWLDRVVTADTETGEPIENSAKSPPSSYPTVRIPQEEITIRQRERSIDFDRAQDQGQINDGTVQIAGRTVPKYCLMLMSYNYTAGYDEDGYVYYDVEYVFRSNYTKNKSGDLIGFKLEWLDAGFNGLLLSGEKYVIKFKGDKGVPTDPVKLDGAGKPLIPQTATSIYNENVLHFLTSFSGYPIPKDWPYGAA